MSVPATSITQPSPSSVDTALVAQNPEGSVTYTPTSTPSDTPQPTPSKASSATLDLTDIIHSSKMDSARDDKAAAEEVQVPKPAEESPATGLTNEVTAKEAAATTAAAAAASAVGQKKSKSKCKKKKRKLHKKSSSSKSDKKKDAKIVGDDGSDDSDDEDDQSATAESSAGSASDSDESDQDSSSEEESKKKRKKHKKKSKRKSSHGKKKKAVKKDKKKKSKRYDSSDDDSSDSASSDSESEDEHARRKRKNKQRSRKSHEDDEDSTSVDEDEEPLATTDGELELDHSRGTAEAQALAGFQQLRVGRPYRAANTAVVPQHNFAIQSQLARMEALNMLRAKKERKDRSRKHDKKLRDKEKSSKKGAKAEFKRVDQLWDSTIHDYKLTETSEEKIDEFDEYVFNVRRKFDWEGKYRSTVVDIKSKYLRDALAEIMKDVRAISLVEHQPSIDPNMLFLYLEEMRSYYKKTIKEKMRKEKKRKNRKRMKITRAHLKLMVGYLDEDYDETKKTLFPMLKAGNITFELLWAIFKPNSLAFTNTYGSSEHPRCFKVDYANHEKSFIHGEYYRIEGRYLEYDGKNYGLGDFEMHVEHFKGPRKITSLSTYPLQYHKDPDGIKKLLVDRGKKFVSLSGMNYKFMKGLAFFKKKKSVAIKVNINGRIMIDPAIFRRINPNYVISTLKPKEEDAFSDEDDESDSCSDCSNGDDEFQSDSERVERREKVRYKVVYDDKNEPQVVQVPSDEEEDETRKEKLDKLSDDAENEAKNREFTEEELIISSPVVFGFSFTEKAWLEFALSGVQDIAWNEGAFESLVLPENQKSIVKALVSSHKFSAAETIDDVIQGKGKGLVFVLHGPPGVGKTLTAEGIAEYLRCPLYAVSAGELGTDARIEHELQKIMDIAHSWGAVLLLDEADVFLEKRQHQDVHRNALVSIFLRLLEYFQGILFLTTNRVETFDDAFQSRIHMPLRYEELTPKAKKEIWRLFLQRVRDAGGAVDEFKDNQLTILARNNLNGRQIKNAVKTAQALAVHEKAMLTMEHIKRVLDVAESFERDLKGGTGYLDAMRSYT